jgi:site-specific recombinase XerD
MSPEISTSNPKLEPEAHITANSLLIPTIMAWEYYLEDQGLSPYTIKAFLSDMNLFSSYFPPDRKLGDLSTQDINNFLDWLESGRNVPCSPKSLARRITSIKAFFRWLYRNAVVLIDPAEKVPQKTVISPLPVVLTPDETDTVLQSAEKYRHADKPDARPYTLVSLLFSTGIKKGECLTINLNHIELDNPNGAILFVRYANPKYRYKERKISLPQEWLTAFDEYQTQYELKDQLFPWSPRRLEYLLEDLSNEAGLEKHLSFDMCRWTCALNDWQAGLDHEKIRQKLGISKIQWREIKLKLQRLSNPAGEID